MRRAVGNVEMTVRAEVASVTMPIESVLALKEGDLLRLNSPAAAGITLYADKVPVHTGRPGRSGSRRAVQVTGRLGGASMSAYDALDAAWPVDRRGVRSACSRCSPPTRSRAARSRPLDDAKSAFAGMPVPSRRHVGVLRRRRHRRQRLPDHAGRRPRCSRPR